MKALSAILSLAFLAGGCSRHDAYDTMKTPSDWPEEWSGNTALDFGDNGRMQCEIITEGTPGPAHIQNYEAIRARWSTVWPAARTQISKMLKDYEQNPEIKNPLFKMEIRIPAEAIEDGASWSISAVQTRGAKGDSGWYNCEFIGWSVDEESSQPYF